MNELVFSVQNVIDGGGITVSVVGMTIVFFALATVSLVIGALPKFLKVLSKYMPEKEEHNASAPQRSSSDSEKIAIAAAFAFHKN